MFVQMPAVNRDILIPVEDVLKTLAAVSTASRLVHLTVIAQVVSPVLQPNTNSILVTPVILNPVVPVLKMLLLVIIRILVRGMILNHVHLIIQQYLVQHAEQPNISVRKKL